MQNGFSGKNRSKYTICIQSFCLSHVKSPFFMDEMYKKAVANGSVSGVLSFFPYFLDKLFQRVYNSIVNQTAANSEA